MGSPHHLYNHCKIKLQTIGLYLPVFFTLFSLLTSCMDEDYASGTNDRLMYSTDTLRFDTLFTTIGSSTHRLMVYNQHKKAIHINSIILKNDGRTGFKVNVDGIKGTHFEDVEILKNDSLYIFVEANIKPTQQNMPQRTEEILEIEYNGIRQQIIIEAYAQDAVMWHGKIIDKDTILSSQKPFLIYDSLKVMPGAQLQLQAGTKLYLHDRAQIIIEGQLISNGLLGAPVQMRGDRLDRIFPTLPYAEMSGQWGGIIIKDSSFENILSFTHIQGTDFGIRIDSTSIDKQKLQLNSCRLSNSNNELVKATNAWIEVTNSELVNSAGALLYLNGGKYRFTQCTLANFYQLGMVTDDAVHLSNYLSGMNDEQPPLPLLQASFNNCIIWGKRHSELRLDKAKDETVPFIYLFDHCLIRSEELKDDSFINTVWDEDPQFLKTGKDYQFDFRIDSLSPARSKGDSKYASELPVDIIGNARSEQPDLGAYQWTE